MVELEGIDKTVQGWGLFLGPIDREQTLQHLLWQCQTKSEFIEKCGFVFGTPLIKVVWEKGARSAVVYGKQHEIVSSYI